MVKNAVNEHWYDELTEQASKMKTLKYLNTHNCCPGYVHTIWSHNTDPLEAHMATVKARILVQRYPLSSSHCAGKNASPTCPLCREGEETTEHFLIVCPALMKRRVRYLENLYKILTETGNTLPSDTQGLVKMLLTPEECVSEDVVEEVEQLSR